MTATNDDYPCSAFVESVTDYLDGSLDPDDARRLEEHLAACAGCRSVLEQFRIVIDATGRLQEQDLAGIPDATRASLMRAFRKSAGRDGG